MDLSDAMDTDDASIPDGAGGPLAAWMRPRTLDGVIGQGHLLAEGSPLRRLAEASGGAPPSVFLWGPPGTGETTSAHLIARAGNRHFEEMSAVSAGMKELRAVISAARQRLATSGCETILFVDEVHRFSRAQQDALLPAVENGWVTLVAATTKNPPFIVISPFLSRSLLVTLKGLVEKDIRTLVAHALEDERGFAGRLSTATDVSDNLARIAGHDGRRSLTFLGAAAGGARTRGEATIELADIIKASDGATVRYDRADDQHYGIVSAFIKSIRGSDVDVAMHYPARMLSTGEDPRFIARRLMINAIEDVGMTDPSALQMAMTAAQSVALVGMPETRIILAEAVTHLATAPKSNRAYVAVNATMSDAAEGKAGPIPEALRDMYYANAKDLGHGEGYKYAHGFPGTVAPMKFMPEGLEGVRYYNPGDRGYESQITSRLAQIRKALEEGS